MDSHYFLTLCFALLCFFSEISIAADTLIPSGSISGDQTLVSQGGFFELGFFSPGNSKNRYLGMWYKKIPVRTVVWVANRENPLTNSSGILKIDDKGNLVLVNRTESVIWSSNSWKAAENPVVQLLESGNLVLRDEKDGKSESYIWQSFDYPSDTLLPGMKLGWDLKTGLNRHLTSWKNADDPSPGGINYGIENLGYPEAVMRKGSVKRVRRGPWNGLRYSGAPELMPNPIFKFNFISNGDEVYYTYQLNDESILSRLVVNETDGGVLQRSTWIDQSRGWQLVLSVPKDYCDTYGLCGAYGTCDLNETPFCQCLKGFKARLPLAWNSTDWSGGCKHEVPLDCQKGEGFVKFTELKLPDTTHAWANKSMSLKECEAECLKNCSCMAYTNSDISGGGSGCALWFGDLIDIRRIRGGGQDLHIRMAASELEGKGEPKNRVIMIVAIVVALGTLLLGWCGGWYIWKRKNKPKDDQETNEDKYHPDETRKDELDLPLFDLVTISTATDNFSIANKLGEGGFGPVYKGKLLEGQEIAVKKLSKYSVQGGNEFMNEVISISKLQHRNLVKLLGCCIHGEEKMLIYEYLPNKSLDCFIFDKTRCAILDWRKRFNIVLGIARGLLYLHQDSRLRIIHRDLKASNILLDSDMDPKISDFGMARIFGRDQIEASTSRVVGTYGYMSPEYAIDGHFSVKSDVFSFGVLVIEIVTGKKNRGFYHPDHQLNLLGHAWRLWNEGKVLQLINESMRKSCTETEVLRCIHVGLLCVQQGADDRPIMSTVVLMLGSESALLPQPKQPGFFIERSPMNLKSWDTWSKGESSTSNDITSTMLQGR